MNTMQLSGIYEVQCDHGPKDLENRAYSNISM
jgi:hypothetical protein